MALESHFTNLLRFNWRFRSLGRLDAHFIDVGRAIIDQLDPALATELTLVEAQLRAVDQRDADDRLLPTISYPSRYNHIDSLPAVRADSRDDL